jgi:CubicO group peptidase (beta-lactamase class C family)
MSVWRVLVLACLCVALVSGLACKGDDKTMADTPPLTTSAAKDLADLKATLRRLAATGRFSGAVLIAKDGKVVFSRAYGLADRDRRVRNTVETRFRIG